MLLHLCNNTKTAVRLLGCRALASVPHSHSNLRMSARYMDKNSQSILWKTVYTNNMT